MDIVSVIIFSGYGPGECIAKCILYIVAIVGTVYVRSHLVQVFLHDVCKCCEV